MIPHKLQLKNFLSYGPDLQTIDFSHHHLICLSGKNGHGKSALLDAMTWALWGQARKVVGNANAAQGLLHLGQTQMLVILDFEFNGQHYRIRREYMQTYGKPIASLEFGIFDVDTDTLIPLTDKTIRMTQHKIEQTLRLDFETFVNSAFLRQGNANEFSKKSPKDRKKILASILGLDQYDVIRKLALDKVKHAAIKKQTFITLQDKLVQELATIPALHKQIKLIDQQLTDLKHLEQHFEKKKIRLNEKQKEYNTQQKKHEILIFKLEQFEQEEKEKQNSLRPLVVTWRNINYKQHGMAPIAGLETEKKQLFKTIEIYQQQLQQNLEIKEQLLAIKEKKQQIEYQDREQVAQQIQQKQLLLERFQIQKQTTEIKIKELTEQLHQYEQEQDRIQQTLQTMHKQQLKKINNEQLLTQEQQFEKRKSTYQHFATLGNLLQKELDNLEQKKRFTHDDNNPSCPLCEQNLSASRRRFLKKKFAKQGRFLQHRLNRLHAIIPNLKTLLVEQHQLIATYKEQRDKQVMHERNTSELQREKQKLALHCKQLKEQIVEQKNIQNKLAKQMSQQLATITEQQMPSNSLQNNKTYQQQVKRINNLQTTLANNKYNTDQHKKIQKQLIVIEQQLHNYEQINKEINKQGQRKQDVSKLCMALKKIKKIKQSYEQNIATYKNLSQQQTELEKQEITLNQKYKQIHTQKETILQEKGSLKARQKKLNQLEEEHKEQQKIIGQLNKTIDEYQIIATATSKDGIQALLIEEAIPEIEQEANQLLAKLTNNQAHIIIDSLRDLKKGGTKETLDIKISDSIGVRPYELFSGGEAFRIDFSLRIAISKLLARRSGTALQTLIIDEGFGSQDEEGLGQIMDALHKIQNDFSKIIIVSHLEALKDQFPVHLVITKGPRGSIVKIVELG